MKHLNLRGLSARPRFPARLIGQGGTRLLAQVVGPIGLGAFAGVFVLHPITMVIYWFEFNPPVHLDFSVWHFVLERMTRAFGPEMLPMTSLFLLLGATLGLVIATAQQGLARRNHLIRSLHAGLGRDLAVLVAGGEGETVEFKSSVRWDTKLNKVNKILELQVVKTVAGFFNNHGGTLLLGVEDSGTILGLKMDYATLQKKNRDGLEQFLMGSISSHLSADLCPLVHVLFHEVDRRDVCRVLVEPSPHPVYSQDRSGVRYFLRAGNTTRELNVREAAEHIAQRYPTAH